MSEARNSQNSRHPVIPDKLYFRIGEVARLLDVETHTLRFWETEFPQLKVGKGGTGQRLYRRRDVELVFEIKRLLYEEGYTIPGARQFLQNQHRPKTAAPIPPKHEPAAQNGPEREPSLERIRSELRDLSALLTDSAHDRASSATWKRDRNRSGTIAPRRGLHLATRAPEKPVPARSPTKPASPGLFDPESD